MASDWKRIEQAAAKYGHTLDSVAQRYVDPLTGKRLSGRALILKTVKLESGGRRDAVSRAGARAWAQFMPGTRAAVINQYGIDPWRSPEEAVHALTLHMRGKLGNATGLEGYNPGDPNYPAQVLAQRVGAPTARASGGLGGRLAASTSQGTQPAAPDASQTFSPGDLAALTADVQQPPGPPVSAPAPPTFAAGPVTPKLYQGLSVPGAAPAASQEGALGARLAEIAAQGGDPSADFSQQPAGSDSSTTNEGASSSPVKGAKHGDPVVGGTGVGGTHPTSGLPGYPAKDYFAPSGSTAVAPVSGKVVKLSGHDPKDGPVQGPHGPLGWSVYIAGSDGHTYFLTHLGSRDVKLGSRVKAGQPIGTVADYAKYGTPSHIHMGVH